MKIEHTVDYKNARRNRYPDLAEQLGDIWKLLENLAAINPSVAAALKECASFQRIKEVKRQVGKPGK